ncbi:MAG: hypothetical protein ACT4OO_10975 [Nitrospiraceae bacterium]
MATKTISKRRANQSAGNSRSSNKSIPPTTRRKMPSRLAKRRLRERLQQDTQMMKDGGMLNLLRKQGYEELPLDELQDRLSKLQSPLAQLIIKGRG